MSNHRNKRSRKGKENTPGNGKGNGSSRNGTSAHPKANGHSRSRSHTQDESISLLDTAPRRTIRIDPTIPPAIEEDGSGSMLEESFFSRPPKPGLLVAERPDPENEVAYSGNGHEGHDGVSDEVGDVAAPAPVKVRVGQPYDLRPFSNGTDHLLGTNGNGVEHNGNGNGHHDTGNGYHSNGSGNGNGHYGNGNGNGSTTGSLRRARISLGRDTVVVAPGTVHPTTGHLRSADLMKARIKLGNGHAPAATMPLTVPRPLRPTTGIHTRELPYFLMRHRNIRGKSRVGHTRAGTASKRFGSAGPMRSFLLIFVAINLVVGLVAAGGIGAGVAGAFIYIEDLPDVDEGAFDKALLANGINVQTTKIYDRNGVSLYEAVDEETGRREEVKLNEISPWVISATLAAEDADFYTNPGIDIRGIVRAININLTGQGSSGASTITQQLARDIFLPDEEAAVREGWAAVNRKIKEMALAIKLTRQYPGKEGKDKILETYLNQIFYGHGAYGIQAAAFVYFGKDAKELNVEEAALLAGLPQQPTLYDPYVNGKMAKRRQELVLDLMARQGMLTTQEAAEAKAIIPVLRPYKPIIRAPHFAYYVKSYLEANYPGILKGGYKVYTTLDLRVQEMAQKIAKDRVEEIKKQRASNAAIVIMKPRTGEILAMVGSVDYNDPSIDGQVNVAVAERQPGSSFKPITFATAFTKGWSPGTTLLDVLTQFPGGAGQKPYVPKNYDGRDHGWVTVRESLANSYNIPAVKALQFAGIQETIDMAHAMGIRGLNKGLDYYGLSLTLGGGEVTLLDMTTAYSTFANQGLAVGANPILRIERPDGTIAQELPSNPEGKQAMDPRVAYLISDILSDNRARTPAFGSNSALRTSFTSAAKTGTTDNNRDSWTMGYTPNLTVGVWVGNSDNAEMNRITGAIGAAVIWNKVMEDFHDNEDFVRLIQRQNPDGTLAELQEEFVEPEGIVRASACSARGGVTDLFLTDNRPGRNCVTYRDPKTNVLLHSLPGERQPQSQPRQNQPRQPQQRRAAPTARPTPIPGIFPWTP
jgi:penicillin-binding protein 1C